MFNEKLACFTIHNANDIGVWMGQHGCKFQPAMRGTLRLTRTNGFFPGGGKGLINAYYATAHKLGAENIESRPVWKPMNLQPVFDCGLATKLRSASFARQADTHGHTQNSKKRYKAGPSEIRSAVVNEFHRAGKGVKMNGLDYYAEAFVKPKRRFKC